MDTQCSDPVVSSPSANQPFTACERGVANALSSIPQINTQQRRQLLTLLGEYGEDAIVCALRDLLVARSCNHDKCVCILKKSRSSLDREVIDSFRSGKEAKSFLLARAFIHWCRRHRETERRRSKRMLPFSARLVTDIEGNVESQLDRMSEDDALYPREQSWSVDCEERLDGSDLGSVQRVIIARAQCTELEAAALVFVDSRPKRTFGAPVDANTKTAASRARMKVRRYLASCGIFDTEDLAVFIEEGGFREQRAA